jgi:hypothetical protein
MLCLFAEEGDIVGDLKQGYAADADKDWAATWQP